MGDDGNVFVERISKWGEATFRPPATEPKLRDCEARLGESLPAELRTLLSETNGIEGEYGLGLVWRVERIEADNVRFRSDLNFAEWVADGVMRYLEEWMTGRLTV